MNGASDRPIAMKDRVLMRIRTKESLTLFQGLFAKCSAQAGVRGGDILSGFDVLLFIVKD
jgi:hypothetical protein